MARVTVEDCLKKVDNRFGLIHLTAKRVRQLRKGAEPLVICKNKDVVTSLREIAVGEVYQVEDDKGIILAEEEESRTSIELPEQAADASSSKDKDDQEVTPKKS